MEQKRKKNKQHKIFKNDIDRVALFQLQQGNEFYIYGRLEKNLRAALHYHIYLILNVKFCIILHLDNNFL